MSEFRTFVVPYDFSPHARAALDTAIDLAKRLDASVHLVHVVQHPAYGYAYGTMGGAAVGGAAALPPIDLGAIREHTLESLREVAREVEARLPGKVEPHVFDGPTVAITLLEAADQLGADLIVMGTHGRTGLAHVFLGSVAERTLRRATCPVLTVQGADDPE